MKRSEMSRRKAMGWLVAGTTLLSGCGLVGSSNSYRYRMTVEVDTPEGIKSGSSVQETIFGKSNVDLGELSAKRGMRTRGEAVAVDLPGGRTLFALMPDARLIQSILDPEWKNDWVESGMRINSGATPQGPLPMTLGRPKPVGLESGYPMLVTFTDIADPTSVRLVDPANLAASFGADVSLRRITVQVTDGEVTDTIEQRLRVIGIEPNHGLDRTQGARANPTLAQSLGYRDFRR